MNRYILTFILCSVTTIIFSQNNAAPGTYQLMTTNVKVAEVFTTDILELIESKRELNQTVVIKIAEYTWVRILSLNAINDPNFVPLPEGTIEIDPNDTDLILPKTNISN